MARWLGEETGFRGICVGAVAGAVTPGGPFTHFPILASLIGKGAGAGPVAAYTPARSLIGIHRMLSWEAPILGWRFVAARLIPSVACPLLIGLFVERLGKWIRP